MSKPKPVSELSFEEALVELQAITKEVDSGSYTLEKTISSYERALELKRACEERLKQAKLRIEYIESASSSIE